MDPELSAVISLKNLQGTKSKNIRVEDGSFLLYNVYSIKPLLNSRTLFTHIYIYIYIYI